MCNSNEPTLGGVHEKLEEYYGRGKIPQRTKDTVNKILTALQRGENWISLRMTHIDSADEACLMRAFALKGWSITINNSRSDCSVKWEYEGR